MLVKLVPATLIKNIKIKIEAITCKSMGEYFDFILSLLHFYLLNALMMMLI